MYTYIIDWVAKGKVEHRTLVNANNMNEAKRVIMGREDFKELVEIWQR